MAAAVSQSDSRYLNSHIEIKKCLTRFRDERTPLTLMLDSDGQKITVKVLDVTIDGFLVDDILPRSALDTLRKRPAFSISVRADGCYAFVEQSKISDEGEARGLPYFHIPLPSSMLYQQRRKAARINLPLRVSSAGAHVTVDGTNPITGSMIDISAGGLRAKFPQQQPGELKLSQVLKDCTLSMPPHLELHTECTVRHCHTQRDGSVVVGFEFTDMAITDRRRLEQFIQSLVKYRQ